MQCDVRDPDMVRSAVSELISMVGLPDVSDGDAPVGAGVPWVCMYPLTPGMPHTVPTVPPRS